MKLLLIEDDALLGEGIKSALTHFSYVVDWVTDGRQGLSALDQDTYALAILDLGLPDQDGLTLLKTIRQRKTNIPVLILTARGEMEDKLAGLDAGADDYMVKPFDVRELEARIRTLTRRSENRRTDVIDLGRSRLNTSQRILELDGKEIEFSRREFPLIQAFFAHPKQIYTREALESLSYGWDDDIESNALEVHIHRLRKKLGNGAIKTVRGVGYMLVEEFFV
jgi:two-component system response regulator QseB